MLNQSNLVTFMKSYVESKCHLQIRIEDSLYLKISEEAYVEYKLFRLDKTVDQPPQWLRMWNLPGLQSKSKCL